MTPSRSISAFLRTVLSSQHVVSATSYGQQQYHGSGLQHTSLARWHSAVVRQEGPEASLPGFKS